MNLLRMNLSIALIVATVLAAGHQWLRAADPAPEPPKPAAEKVIYTCPMHPRVESPKPGTCPICKMALKAKKVAATAPPPKSNAPMPADAMASASTPTPDHADSKMDGAGTDRGGMNMSSAPKGMQGMSNCPMSVCMMPMGSMPESTGKAAKAPVSAVGVSSAGGGCACR